MSLLNLYCPINTTGYGVISVGIINGLLTRGISDFHLVPLGQIQANNQLELVKYAQQTKVLWDRTSPSVAIWHEFDLNKFSSNKLIAFPIFETNNFNLIAKNYLKQMNAIFVLSGWARGVMENFIGTSVPVHVVQGASDCVENNSINAIQKNSVFTFFNVGKLEKRKAHIELIKAYTEVFKDRKEDTRLICHCFNPFDKNFVNTIINLLSQLGLRVHHSSSVQEAIVASKGNALVEIPKNFLLKQQIFQLYKYGHIGVFPSKAEGWNLPLMEAIKTGTPCIASNYSAHTEFLNKNTGYPEDLLLNKHRLEIANDGIFFHGDRGEWATPDINELKELLLYSYQNYDKILSNFNNEKIKTHFTWENTTNQFLDALNNYK